MRAARTGLELLTAWSGEPQGGPLVPDLIVDHIRDGDPEQITDVIVGLVNVAGRLLIMTAEATNRTQAEVLQELGRDYASE